MALLELLAQRKWARHTLVFCGYLGLSVLMLWPLPLHMSDHVVAAKYYWDAYTNTMLLSARTLSALGMGGPGIYDSYFFAPIPNSIAFNENLFGLSLLYAPFLLISHNPLLAYNIVLCLSLALSSYFTLLFVSYLTKSELAGLIAGVAFPYCPYAFFEMGRIQLVATQWIPLCFLFLHRAIAERRLRDIVGLGLAYTLQVGTCLYYAMFLLPLMGLLAGFLALRHRPFPLAFFAKLAAAVGCTAVVIGLMIQPYFASRKHFDLTRTEDFADDFDGELSFFVHVDPQNHALKFMGHEPKVVAGAHEEIAFPGFIVLGLASFALAWPARQRWKALPPDERKRILRWLLPWPVVTGAVMVGLTLVTHSLLVGTLVLVASAVAWTRVRRGTELLPTPIALYAAALILSVLLFLGLSPFDYHGKPIHGLYYYLHTYAPGWNGIRKISRQAIMTSFIAIVLAGFGAAFVLETIESARLRLVLTLGCMLLVALEFREAPVPLKLVPAGRTVPSAYRYVASQPGKAPIAMLPTNDGMQVYRSQAGMALHNYMSIYHGRRTLNGKSSFIPPVTRIFMNAMTRMPSELSARILKQLGAQFLMIHSWDMPEDRAIRILQFLKNDHENYKLAYRDGTDYVFQVLPCEPGQDDCQLDTTPALPAAAMPIPGNDITLSSNIEGGAKHAPFDDDPKTRWTTKRPQHVGDYVELALPARRELTALEFKDFHVVDDSPLACRIEVAEGDDDTFRVIYSRPKIRLFREQIYDPLHFVFRVVFPPHTVTNKLRITILEPVPGRWWSIHTLKVYAR